VQFNCRSLRSDLWPLSTSSLRVERCCLRIKVQPDSMIRTSETVTENSSSMDNHACLTSDISSYDLSITKPGTLSPFRFILPLAPYQLHWQYVKVRISSFCRIQSGFLFLTYKPDGSSKRRPALIGCSTDQFFGLTPRVKKRSFPIIRC
jgi:hypothetical protein